MTDIASQQQQQHLRDDDDDDDAAVVDHYDISPLDDKTSLVTSASRPTVEERGVKSSNHDDDSGSTDDPSSSAAALRQHQNLSLDELKDKKSKNKKVDEVPRKNLPVWKLIGYMLSCFFIVVATVLGTGILALPVKVGDSGFWPFFTTFFFCMLAQVMIIVYMFELLQRTEAVQLSERDNVRQRSILSQMDRNVWSNMDDRAAATTDDGYGDVAEDNDVNDDDDDDDHEDHQTTVAMEGATTTTATATATTPLAHSRHSYDGNTDIDGGDQSRKSMSIQPSQDYNTDSPVEDDIIATPVTGKKKRGQKSMFMSQGPDLHVMGSYFLTWKFMRALFEFSVTIHFISIMITYSIGGSSAWAQLFGIKQNFQIIIPIFVIVLACVVIFAQKIISHVITIATLVKGSMLVFMVFLVGGLALQMNKSSHDNWAHIGRPFLISTVALGGAMNTLPVLYSKLNNPSRQTLIWVRAAAVAAVMVCWFLNVLWVYFILKMVPQFGDHPSLEYSKKEGEIATIPLVEIIQERFPDFAWVALVVQLLIVLSITVSFITMSSGMKHLLDGYVKSFTQVLLSKDTNIMQRIGKWIEDKSPRKFFSRRRAQPLSLQFFLYIFFFGLTMIVALINPKSFFEVMEIFTSMALNIESGAFVALMFWNSRRMAKYSHLSIPLPLSRFWAWTCWPVATYFIFAVVYDCVYSPLDLIFKLQGKELPF